MRTSQSGVDLIKEFEGCKLSAYACPAGIPTIGVGHTGPDVKMGMTITDQRAEELLEADLLKFERGVSGLVKDPLTQGQFDALVSFAFNLGVGALAKSTLLKKVLAHDFAGAAGEFGKWVHSGAVVLPGLVKRREAERLLFVGASGGQHVQAG